MQFLKERTPTLLYKSRWTLTPSKASECDRILSFILHPRTWSQARNGTSLYPGAGGAETGDKCEAGLVCSMSWVRGQPWVCGMNITHLLSLSRPSQCLFAVSTVLVLSTISVSLYPLCSLDLLPLEGKKKIFNNLKEKMRVTTPSFSETLPHYIWRFLPHQRGEIEKWR